MKLLHIAVIAHLLSKLVVFLVASRSARICFGETHLMETHNSTGGQLGDVERSQAYSRVFMMNGAWQKKNVQHPDFPSGPPP